MSKPDPILIRIYRKIPKTPLVIRGNLVLMRRSCGQKRCRCQRGHKHASWYLSQSVNGKTKMTYLPKGVVERMRQYTQHYKQTKNALEELSKVNIELLIKEARS